MTVDLDELPHRRCATCNDLRPHRRMIEHDNKWFCSIICSLKGARNESHLRTDRTSGALVAFPRRPPDASGS